MTNAARKRDTGGRAAPGSGTFRKVTSEEEHRHLDRLVNKLYGVDHETTITNLVTLVEFLGRHFAHEEGQGGLFEMVVQMNPRLQRRAEMLASEHAALLRSAERLFVLARMSYHGVRPSLQTGIDDLVARLKQHEEDEHDMLQMALLTDMGVGD